MRAKIAGFGDNAGGLRAIGLCMKKYLLGLLLLLFLAPFATPANAQVVISVGHTNHRHYHHPHHYHHHYAHR